MTAPVAQNPLPTPTLLTPAGVFAGMGDELNANAVRPAQRRPEGSSGRTTPVAQRPVAGPDLNLGDAGAAFLRQQALSDKGAAIHIWWLRLAAGGMTTSLGNETIVQVHRKPPIRDRLCQSDGRPEAGQLTSQL